MTAPAQVPGDLRSEAARLAFALIRFQQPAAHATRAATPKGVPVIGADAYVFAPSSRRIPVDQVEAFLVSLPSPALLTPTLNRGGVVLTLFHELSGERRRSMEHDLNNQASAMDAMAQQLGLSDTSRVLLEFEDESHVFSFAAVREWGTQFAVSVGWNISTLEGDANADACLKLIRSDWKEFRGRSCLLPPRWFQSRGEGPVEPTSETDS
jgi:hypothetical protein